MDRTRGLLAGNAVPRAQLEDLEGRAKALGEMVTAAKAESAAAEAEVQSWSETVFAFEPTAGIIVGAMVFATVMGLLGGFFPALRAARISPIDAMRA